MLFLSSSIFSLDCFFSSSSISLNFLLISDTSFSLFCSFCISIRANFSELSIINLSILLHIVFTIFSYFSFYFLFSFNSFNELLSAILYFIKLLVSFAISITISLKYNNVSL